MAGIEAGILCVGSLLADGTINVLIGNVTVIKRDKGQYEITHNIGHLNYVVIATAGNNDRYVHSIIYDINYIRIRMASMSTNVQAESKVNFMILKA